MSAAPRNFRCTTALGAPAMPESRRHLGWLIPILTLVVWEIAVRAGAVSATMVPPPSGVLAAAWRLTSSGELPHHIGVSALRAATGLLIGGGIGFALGLSNGLSRLSEHLLDSTLQLIRNVPNLALIPLAILWLGIGEPARILLVALGVFFPVYINTFHGIRTVDPQLVEMARAYGMNGRDLFWRVVLQAALPSIFVGLRYALGIMWLTLIVAETIAADAGIGRMAMDACEFLLVDIVLLAILIYALFGKFADSAARFLERRSLQWHPAFQNR